MKIEPRLSWTMSSGKSLMNAQTSQPLGPWRCDELNSIETTTHLSIVLTGNWDQVHSNFTGVIYQQLKTAHTVNRNICQTYLSAPSGADDGTTGWALGTVGLRRFWRITLPLSDKRLKCSCTTTSRDENVWITPSRGLEKCIYWRMGSNTQVLLGAWKRSCISSKLKTFKWILECPQIRKTDRRNNTNFFLSTERTLPVPSWPISQEM